MKLTLLAAIIGYSLAAMPTWSVLNEPYSSSFSDFTELDHHYL